MSECIKLEACCDRCGLNLVLYEGANHLIGCLLCDAEPGEGATPSDALERWYELHPPAVLRPAELPLYVVPAHPWVIEVNGYPFNTLAEAEACSAKTGFPIYCRLAASQKAANQ